MSKISIALSEIYSIDDMATKDQWVNKLHPLVKLVLTVVYITMVVSFGKYSFTGLLGMCVYPIVMFIVGEVPVRNSLYKLRIVLPVVCLVGILNPFFDRKILWIVCGIPVSGGMISMITLMVKGILTVSASYLFIATTTIENICYAMRLMHLPKLFVTQVLLLYRYITVLLKEAERITEAYSLRAPNQKGIHVNVWGTLIGQLLLRSMDRAESLYESMCLRGYSGDFYLKRERPCGKKDYCYLVIWLGIFVLLRWGNVLELVGNIVM
ncbi:cobalt ECF transporter T component CbiQ [Lachnospiraceae bacterium LCP25S3_G4]